MKSSKQPRLSHKFAVLQHSHKKRKDSLETRTILLLFWLELEIFGGVRTGNTSKERKGCFSEHFLFSFSIPILIATV